MLTLSIQNPLFSLSQVNIAYDMQSHARVLLKGPDAKSFLHRLSTNAVIPCQTGDSCLNALVNQKGRLVDVFHQVIINEQEVLLISSLKKSAELCTWLDQFLFVEKVRIEDISKTGSLVCVFGGNPIVNLLKWQSGINGEQIIMRSFDFIDENLQKIHSFLIYDRYANAAELIKKLSPSPMWIDHDSFETARIAAGICAFPTEINDTYNPLELFLNDSLHWDKGCYIGQEVISRLHTYQKLSKQLCRVSTSKANFNFLKTGQSLLSGDQNIGQLTSVAPYYWPKHVNALAMIKQKTDQEAIKSAIIQADRRQIAISFVKTT
jgi:tRNA-modifying protein YgfZ